MRTVWKYPLPRTKVSMIEMPAGSSVLAVMVQDLEPVIYCEVDPTASPIRRGFAVFGTGDPIEGRESLHYVGTFQIRAIVYHLYTDRIEYPLEDRR